MPAKIKHLVSSSSKICERFSDNPCPDPKCALKPSARLVHRGFTGQVKCLNGERRQRFKCTSCRKSFTENYSKIHYRLMHKDPALNSKILSHALHGLSNRKISRLLSISEHSVRIRMDRLAKRALEFHQNILGNLAINEALCFDGLENFAGSQYDPNNVQQAIGRDSLFIYDFNFASLNRKGRTSPWQKRRLAGIVGHSGRYNPKNIRIATRDILQRLYERRDMRTQGLDQQRALPKQPFTLLSDEHFQYRRVINQDLKHLRINHLTISSKACRNYQNILFSVNHADLLIRQSVAAFARETISFSKTAGRMCQRFALFMVSKNYMNPQFTKKHKTRVDVDRISPAQRAGVCKNLLGFSDIFSERSLEHRISDWNEDWKCFWNAEVPTKYLRSRAYA